MHPLSMTQKRYASGFADMQRTTSHSPPPHRHAGKKSSAQG